jgi:OmpA family protein
MRSAARLVRAPSVAFSTTWVRLHYSHLARLPQLARMRNLPAICSTVAAAFALTGCATAPAVVGPTVMALPAKGTDLAKFQSQDAQCRNYAWSSVGYVSPGQIGASNLASGSAVGTAIGAGAGAVLGAVAGNPGAGAAIGAATGLVGGAAVGANAAAASEFDLQTRYNIAYTQCMYAFGNTVESAPPGYYGYPYYLAYSGLFPYDYYYGASLYPWYYGPSIFSPFFASGFFFFGGGHNFHHGFFPHHGFYPGFHGGWSAFHGGWGGFHGGFGGRH